MHYSTRCRCNTNLAVVVDALFYQSSMYSIQYCFCYRYTILPFVDKTPILLSSSMHYSTRCRCNTNLIAVVNSIFYPSSSIQYSTRRRCNTNPAVVVNSIFYPSSMQQCFRYRRRCNTSFAVVRIIFYRSSL